MGKRHGSFFNKFPAMVASFVAMVSMVGSGAAYASAANGHPGKCQPVKLSVALAPNQLANQTIHGTLCRPNHWNGKPSVDVLVHGATYNSTYWNWPIDNAQYSYVNQTLRAGRATFAYDAVGSTMSSHPLSTDVTLDANAYVLHQVLHWLHGRHAYAKFDVVGHSLGSMTAVAEAGTYHDEDALVLTGYSHAFNPVNEANSSSYLYPANQDPQFAADNLDSGYLTTKPGDRAPLFYSSIANPAITAYDEAHKDIVSGTYVFDALTATNVPAATNPSNSITVPVLEVIGQEDMLYCGTGAVVNCASPASVRAFDAPYFTHARSLTVQTTPDTGHDLALHSTDFLTFSKINQWLTTH